MKASDLFLVAVLAACGTAFAQSDPGDASAGPMAITGECTKSGIWDPKREATQCHGPWTLTFRPAKGTAAHLVGGMSPVEVKAVLDATGLAYAPRSQSSLRVDRAVLWFGDDGLEAWGREPRAATPGT